ncbi:MAG: glycosyltransferase family 4 protein [Planctomycetes bacterium]|nr:glycosyltransferase family 4 protein [Planctomycetota bacterium]MBL7043510.1 glycosyltransferase family 4 protein [Pirellulaceae bacterium]
MKVAYLTAGAAGMYCGSCMHDNTLAAALGRLGVDIQLIPTYTPIRTDENDVSVDRVFFGGVNVFLQQRFPLFRRIPAWLDRILDRPRFIRWVTSRAIEIDPKELGGLTVSMLKGEHGFQRKEVRRLCQWLASSVKPDLVVLTNVLIGGCIPEIKRKLNVPVLVTLQGDDVFLDQLVEPFKSRAFEEIQRLVECVDGFVVNSRYYADFIEQYFGIHGDKLEIVPLGIDTRDFHQSVPKTTLTQSAPTRQPTIGYLARLAPEKGLHVLVDAFIELRKKTDMGNAQLRVAGWLGEQNREYAETEFAKLRAAGLADAFHYAGAVSRHEKIEFLESLDVFSVPTTYAEAKGLYVLESLAAGVPVVQPEHGAFPELLTATGGGWLTTPGDPVALAETLSVALADRERLSQFAAAGRAAVHERFNADAMGSNTLEVYGKYVVV